MQLSTTVQYLTPQLNSNQLNLHDAAQGLPEETNVALSATVRALDLDVRQPVPGLPLEELLTAGLLSKFLLCSKQGLMQACHAPLPLRDTYSLLLHFPITQLRNGFFLASVLTARALAPTAVSRPHCA